MQVKRADRRLAGPIGARGIRIAQCIPYGIRVSQVPYASSVTSSLVLGSSAAFVDGSTIQLGFGPGVQYLVSNGWIAFSRSVFGGIVQVFTRSPTGEEHQVSFFSESSTLEALSSDGVVIFRSGPGSPRRWLAPPGEDPIDISSTLGRGFFVGSDPYVAIAGNLFRVR